MSGKAKNSHRTWRDPDTARELTERWIAEADRYRGEQLVRRGRPRGTANETQPTLRITNAVLDFFRASGRGWQTRIDQALKQFVDAQAR